MRNQRGAAAIELAIITPLLLLLITAAVDLGVAWQKSTAIEDTARTAALVGAKAADDANHDGLLIQAMVRNFNGLGVEPPTHVVVFDASATSETPSECLTRSAMDSGGVRGVCASYPQSVIRAIADGTAPSFDGTCVDNPDSQWCASERNVVGGWAVGVTFESRQEAVTGLLPFFPSYVVGDTIVFGTQANVIG